MLDWSEAMVMNTYNNNVINVYNEVNASYRKVAI